MIKNVIIVFLAALILFVLWTLVLENMYAYFLYYLVYLPVEALPNTTLTLKIEAGYPLYTVSSIINNESYTWSLSGELFLLPIVLLLSWQVFLFTILPHKKAFKVCRNNVLVLVFSQFIYLFFLTLYWKSDTIRVIHDMMNNNLIVIVVFLIIKDTIRNHLLEIINPNYS
ncbi:MAG: hypothetical protein R2764_00985 [Bacteroidales bacterium]